MSRLARLATFAAAALALCGGSEPPRNHAVLIPYVELDQIASADLSGRNNDVLTYSQVVAGADASITSQRVQVQVSAQYQRRIPEGHHLGGESTIDGLAVVRAEVVPNLLTVEAGAIATRARQDIRGEASDLIGRRYHDTQQVYAGYAGPTVATQVGDLDVGASYRLGYVRVDGGDDVSLPDGAVALDRYDSSWNQAATVEVGMKPGVALPFGWTAQGGWVHESTNNLKQRSTDKFVRLDVVQPISPSLALIGGVGDESIRVSQQAPQIGPGGLPVLDGHGRYVADRSRGRLLAYDTSGLIWDAGVSWRPSPRTSVEATVGHQYGSTTYTGTATWQFSKHLGLQLGVFDGIQSFGRLLTADVAALPASFQVHRTGLGNGFGGCVYGQKGGTGGCLSDALQSTNTSNFRNRGAYGLISGSTGLWSFGASAAYVRRDYLGVRDPGVFSLDRITDQSIELEGDLRRNLSPRASVEFETYGTWTKTQLLDAAAQRAIGGDASLYYSFSNHLVGTVAAGVQANDAAGYDTDVSASLLLGIRYQF